MKEKEIELKKSLEGLNDKEATILLMSTIMEKLDRKTFSLGKLISGLVMLTSKMVDRGVITQERSLRIAGAAADVINGYIEQEMKN